MQGGVVQSRVRGTPQGGPLSPLLANVLLDEVDKELQRRGHCFVRYADDCNVYVHGHKAGERVMVLQRCLYARLHLTVYERPRIQGHFLTLRGSVEGRDRARKAAAEFMKSPEYRNFVENGVVTDVKVVDWPGSPVVP